MGSHSPGMMPSKIPPGFGVIRVVRYALCYRAAAWRASGSVANPLTLIWLSHGRGQQLGDCPPDAKPDQLPVVVTTFAHFISPPGCHYLSVGSMFADQQIGGTPDVAVGDHSGFIPLDGAASGPFGAAPGKFPYARRPGFGFTQGPHRPETIP
jgi:hypothetical protein